MLWIASIATKSINILRAAAGYRYYLRGESSFHQDLRRARGTRLWEPLGGDSSGPAAARGRHVNLSLAPPAGHRIRESLVAEFVVAPLNRIRIADALDAGEFSHPFYKGLWYWFEIETRVQEWRQRLPAVPFVRFETDWFNDPQRLVALAMELGIAVDRRQIDSSVGVKEHTREHLKFIAPLQLDEANWRFDRFLALLRLRCPEAAAAPEYQLSTLGQFSSPRTLTRPVGWVQALPLELFFQVF